MISDPDQGSNWLENDLKKVDRNKTPWIVLGGHRPMYTSQKVLSKHL